MDLSYIYGILLPMSKDVPRHVSRSDFNRLAVAGVAGGIGLFIASKLNLDANPSSVDETRLINFGESVQLEYFKYINKIPDHQVVINRTVLRAMFNRLDSPLSDPSRLIISLLPDTGFDSPETAQFRHVNFTFDGTTSRIEIAGGRLLGEVNEKDVSPETKVGILSARHSVSLIYGLNRQLVLKGVMGLGQATNKSIAYNTALWLGQMPSLPSWVVPNGSEIPADLQFKPEW